MIRSLRQQLASHRSVILHWAMEITVVVIGVLIALVVQQWAADRGARQRAADAEDRIRSEMLGNAAIMVKRIALYPCLKRRADELMAGLSSGRRDWRLPLAAAGGRPAARVVYAKPVRTIVSDAFRDSVSRGDLDAMAPERVAALSGVYTSLDRLDRMATEEQQLSDSLRPLMYAVPTQEEGRDRMIAAVARLASINQLMQVISGQQLNALTTDAGIRLPAAEFMPLYGAGLASLRQAYGGCVDAQANKALAMPG